MTTALSLLSLPGKSQSFSAKTPADYPAFGLLVDEFDLYQENYAGAVVRIYRAGTTELAPLYDNIQLTGEQLPNPQVLLTLVDDLGNRFGKFAQKVYTPFGYDTDIDTTEQTGIRLPSIYSLAGEDSSDAIARARNATTYRNLADRFADDINALDYGAITTSPATNTVTLTAAIAAAARNGGGRVWLPPGSIPFNQLSLPSGVILCGQGISATTLKSQVAGRCLTITGAAAGLEDLTLDGISLIAGSTGVYGKARNFVTMLNVEVKRFAVGLHWQGGQNHVYRNLFVRNNGTNIRLLGDSDAAGTGGGDEFSGLDWFQGEVSQSTERGIEMSVVDLPVRHNSFHQVDILDNVGLGGAVDIYGASWTTFRQCYWDGNDIHLNVADGDDEEYGSVVGLHIQGGQFLEGEVRFDGLCQDVTLEQMQISGTEFQMNVPVNQIMLRDSVEDDTLITGDATKLGRWRTANDLTVKGVTTDNVATVVWKTSMSPNEVILLDVTATAAQMNGANFAAVSYTHSARCAPGTLAFDEQSANFTVGSEIIGGTSAARAIITAQSDGGTSGTLSLGNVRGDFVDNELITEEGGTGSARVNGVLALGDAALIGSATENHAVGSNTDSVPSGWAVDFAVAEQEVRVTVKGDTAMDIFWCIKIDETRL